VRFDTWGFFSFILDNARELFTFISKNVRWMQNIDEC